ncbi:hypothetical protein HHK36_003350 [Tetracentron sinense]|uniref:SnoaL-like domain-containing protein n=1 Tax=Tetracentron sinense TaxID=13715 RepID=A0A834ZT66_TETSI|nr:hypothetical protein HHK36_003350 [Tetracentron sinense]
MRKLLYVLDPYAFTFNKSMFYMYLCSSSAIHFHSLNPKMGLAASPSPIFCCNKFSSSPRKKQLNAPFSPRAKDAHQPSLNLKPIHTNLLHSPLPNQILIQRSFSSRNTRFSLVPFGAKSSGSGEEDRRALETVLKLYTAIKDSNLRELSDVIGDECRCVCNFISFSHPLYGKKQVLEFFFSLMEYMGKHMEFVVQPTLHDGMNVGVTWKLEWKDTHMPLGKGFSFYMCHTYQGRMVIR